MFFLTDDPDSEEATAVTSTTPSPVNTLSSSSDSAVLVPNSSASNTKPITLNKFLSGAKSKVNYNDLLNMASSSNKITGGLLRQQSVSDVTKKETNDVSRKLFEEEMATLYRGHSRMTKPEWTRERINKIINVIEEHKAAPHSLQRRNNYGYHYTSKYDVVVLGDQKVLIHKRRNDKETLGRIVPSDEYYDILSRVHIATGHGGRDKMISAIKSEYVIPTPVIVIFNKHCKVCETKRIKYYPKSNAAVPEILSTRGKIDLIDMQKTPDGEYKWILHYQDGTTKFSCLRALTSDSLDEIASELLKLFLEIGCPPILETTRSRTFTAALIEKLERAWPLCKILNGKHENDDSFLFGDQIEDMLRAWMCENKSNNWSVGIYYVQFKKNTTKNYPAGLTPFKALFGRDPNIEIKKSHLNSLVNKVDTELELEQVAYEIKKAKPTFDLETNSTRNGDSEQNKSDAPINREMADSKIPSTFSSVIKLEPSEECQNEVPLQSTSVKIEDIEEPKIKIEEDDDIKIEESVDEAIQIESSEDDCVITDIKHEIDIEISVDDEGVPHKRMKIRL